MKQSKKTTTKYKLHTHHRHTDLGDNDWIFFGLTIKNERGIEPFKRDNVSLVRKKYANKFAAQMNLSVDGQ